MDLDSIECVSSSAERSEEDEIPRHHNQYPDHQFPAKTSTNIVGPAAIAPATSVHELLECPVCTNSMYPPIHQDKTRIKRNEATDTCRLQPTKVPMCFPAS